MVFEDLLGKAKEYLPPERLAFVKKAYEFASRAHEGQMRMSGDPYIEHPLQTAVILADLELDASALAASLLHDVTENCDVPISDIEAEFGPEVAKLVDGTTKLGKLSRQASEEAGWGAGTTPAAGQAENLRKLLVAMAEDPRVVFIKLADRLHNMLTLKYLPQEKQQSISRETLEIYAPLAHRLGIWELKWRLEDECFRYLNPEEYNRIAGLVEDKRDTREKLITEITNELNRELEKAGIKAEISGRPKHLYSIYQKMQRYADMGKYFNDIYDLLALRVLVGSVGDCYGALGIVHSLWRPVPDQFDDYIGNPKPNGYQSLHTSVMYQGKERLEIQIRTHDMHDFAERGVVIHWRYKEGEKRDTGFEEGVKELRQLIEWHRELRGAEEFVEAVRTDVFSDQVFVYTPKGEIKDLPKGATPLDFAYQIHTDLGHQCVGAKVNGRLVPLNYQLKNGDVVQIMSAKGDRGPSRDWLNSNLGYTNTSHAKVKIRQWFTKRERTENVERGRELLEKLMRQLGIKFSEREHLAELFKHDNLDDFYNAIGYGGITTHQIASKLTTVEEETPKEAEAEVPLRQVTSTVKVLGAGDMLTQLARCCNPVPGDSIIGYVTRSRGVTVHRRDCVNVVNEEEKERMVSVEWGQADVLYPVRVRVDAWDRVGLMRDVTMMVAEEKVNIVAANLANGEEQTVSIFLTLEIGDLAQLSRLLAKIEGVRSVTSVARTAEGVTTKSTPQTDTR
ncbi:MAG TPA: bifunctional (p)ppGpp synthetase/guanosine-3',5'-bis(diphosphate) 3'-pyrophosphohydrolase [Dehalococcoidia bacterium]|nr:bifunctional (p)ppGpp synthetase/guanosine-3',5'-bis(diphosphate) 3'-pyrophosphohydrolase [Dehalococcoidia bacterium]